jgi:biofilm protein TabA
MILDRLENWHRYFPGPRLEAAFEFLKGLGADTKEGEYPIEGRDIFARVMSYSTRTPEEAVLESHRKYVDVQTVLTDAEGMEWHPAGSLGVETPYDEAKDAIFYFRPEDVRARLNMYPGNFVVFFPEDAHMPQLIVGSGPVLIKKVVVKVKLELFGNVSS